MEQNFDTISLGNLSEASIWSNCTNVSFSAFLDGFNAKKELHLAMLSILATVRDAIQHENGTEADTEYYSGLILTLANVDSDKKLTATLALLQMVLKRVPATVLQHTFADTTAILLLILEKSTTSSYGTYLTKLIIKSFETLLENQDFACWQKGSTQKIFQVILQFIINDHAKIRKSAKCAVISLIHSNEKFGSNSVPARLTAEFCIQKLEEYLATTADEHFKIVSYIFNLLSNALAFFPSVTYTKNVCEAILSYVGLGNSVLCSLAMQTFYSFFLLRPKSTVLTPELNARLLNAFYDYQPNINNGDGLIEWTINMKEGLLSLNNLDVNLFYLHVPKFIRICVQYLQNDSTFVHSNISYVIKSIVNSIGENSKEVPDDLLKKLYTELEATLKYQYSHSWSNIIPMHTEIFAQNEFLQSGYGLIIERMAIIHKSEDDISKLIKKFFIQIIKSRGPRFVLKYCPIDWKTFANSTNECDNTNDGMNNIKMECNNLEYKGEFTNAWLIPLLRVYINEHSELLLFVEHFLPIADNLKKKMLKATNSLSKLKEKAANSMQVDNEDNQESDLIEFFTIMIKELKRVLHAIWSLLPSFCRCPNDVPQAFPKIAQRLGENLYDKEFCVYSLSALRNLLKCDEDIRKKVGLFSKNYLPILFNIYLNENVDKNFHFPILVLINHFVPLLFVNDTQDNNSMNIFNTYFNKLLERLNQPNNSIFMKHSLLDIIRAFLKSTKGFNLSNVQHIYEQITKPLIVNSNLPIDQKKGFRFIEDIIDSDSMACKEFVGNNLINIVEFIFSLYEDSKSLKSPSTKSFTYRIFSKIVEKYYLNDDNQFNNNGIDWDNMLVNILTLVLNNLTIKSSKTKKNARETLIKLSQCFEKMENNPNATRFLSIIINLLKNNPNMDSITKTSCLDAITFLYVQKYHSASNAVVSDIADTILSCLSNTDIISPTRSILNICFDFIKHFLNHASVDLFDSYLEVITCGITNLPEEHKSKYHMSVKIILCKLCRRFGYDLIRSMVPENYQKVIKNIRKIEEKKKKKSNDNETNASEYDQKSRYSRKSKKHDIYDDFSSEENDIGNISISEKHIDDYNEKFDDNDDDDDDENEDDYDPSDLLTLASEKTNILKKNGTSSMNNERKDQLPMSKDGRIILTKLFEQLGDTRGKKRNIDEANEDESDDDSDDNIEQNSYKPGGKGIHRPIQSDTKSKISSVRSRKTTKTKSNASVKSSSKGEVYRSKKAFGDMKRKGLPDPYAYYPFDIKSLNKRKRLKHKGEFKAIIKGAKKGAMKGKYLKNKIKKSK